MAEALSLAGGNKVDKALETLLPRRNASGAGRERLLWNLGLCRVLLQAGQEDMLAAHVKEVLGVLDEFKLERWEPDLAVEALVLALKGLRSEEEAENGKREGILGRIALLNPVKALDLV